MFHAVVRPDVRNLVSAEGETTSDVVTLYPHGKDCEPLFRLKVRLGRGELL